MPVALKPIAPLPAPLQPIAQVVARGSNPSTLTKTIRLAKTFFTDTARTLQAKGRSAWKWAKEHPKTCLGLAAVAITGVSFIAYQLGNKQSTASHSQGAPAAQKAPVPPADVQNSIASSSQGAPATPEIPVPPADVQNSIASDSQETPAAEATPIPSVDERDIPSTDGFTTAQKVAWAVGAVVILAALGTAAYLLRRPTGDSSQTPGQAEPSITSGGAPLPISLPTPERAAPATLQRAASFGSKPGQAGIAWLAGRGPDAVYRAAAPTSLSPTGSVGSRDGWLLPPAPDSPRRTTPTARLPKDGVMREVIIGWQQSSRRQIALPPPSSSAAQKPPGVWGTPDAWRTLKRM